LGFISRETSMALYRFKDRVPVLAKGAWVSDSARVIGDVVIGEGCYVGHGAVVRGDYGSVRLGAGSAVEENAVVHIPPDCTSDIGASVTIGHGAVVHCDAIEDYAVIGMGAILSIRATIGRWAIVAEGAVVPWGAHIPAEKVAAGVPARVVRDVKQRDKDFWTYGKQLYVDLAKQYPLELERIG